MLSVILWQYKAIEMLLRLILDTIVPTSYFLSKNELDWKNTFFTTHIHLILFSLPEIILKEPYCLGSTLK